MWGVIRYLVIFLFFSCNSKENQCSQLNLNLIAIPIHYSKNYEYVIFNKPISYFTEILSDNCWTDQEPIYCKKFVNNIKFSRVNYFNIQVTFSEMFSKVEYPNVRNSLFEDAEKVCRGSLNFKFDSIVTYDFLSYYWYTLNDSCLEAPGEFYSYSWYVNPIKNCIIEFSIKLDSIEYNKIRMDSFYPCLFNSLSFKRC